MLTPHVKAGITTLAARQAVARPHRQRAGRDLGHRGLRAARLPALPGVDLHLDQPRGLPRHPQRPAAEGRRHRQHRRHRHQGRLARRHQPHVHRRRRLDPGAAPGADHLRGDVEGHRARQAGRAAGRHRPCDPDLRREPGLLGRARVLRPRHRPQVPRRAAGAALRPPGHAGRTGARHDLHHRADDQRRPARDPRAGRRLDHRHQGPLAVGAVGAHRAGHRQRLRGADAVGRQPAAAGLCQRRLRQAPAGLTPPPWPRSPRPEATSSAADHVRTAADPAAARAAWAAQRGLDAHALPRRQGGAAGAFPRIARHHAGRVPADQGADAPCRQPPGRAVGAGRHAARRHAGGGGRLRPCRAVPLFRRGRAGAAAGRCRPRLGARRRRSRCTGPAPARHGRRLHARLLGHRAGDRLVGAHRRRMRGAGAPRRHRADGDARGALPVRLAARVQPFPPGHRRGHGPEGLPARQGAGDAPAPRQVRGHALLAGAQLQGKPGRACATCSW